jgi:hypothetical protein
MIPLVVGDLRTGLRPGLWADAVVDAAVTATMEVKT